ncbi:alpha-mannosidase [Paenibacillus montanisoli]|uniref:Alpha-mannosidase n=2 Tax=Paenibacillus montanisoli TaxID=2081970 RepID=A0A328UA58_9BACL|nr:alpha-mannosidase [Paenibacillus montanisoli]
MFLTEKKLEQRIGELEKYRYSDIRPIPEYRFWADQEAVVGAMPPDSAEWGNISLGERWRGWDKTAWLKTEVVIPAEWRERRSVGLFHFGRAVNGHNLGFESLLFVDGVPYQGVGGNHGEVFLAEEWTGRKIELLFKVWSGLNGMTGDKTESEHEVKQSCLAVLEEETDDLYFTSYAVSETLKVLSDNGWEKQQLLKALDRAFNSIDWSAPGSEAFYASVKEANGKLKSEIGAIPKSNEVTVRCIGHTHIDVAWLWRLKHTREKAARSFSTVLRFMERYPEYVFLQSQPQLYDDLERDYPAIHQQIEDRIREGRWEAGGAMWLEADCNVPSGESLVRQLLYGMRFFEQKYGVRCTYLWLPDVFGYSWALPQILRKAGLTSFMTTKISWSTYNRFPHDTFYWRGIDGSEILTHFITTSDPGQKPDSIYKFYTYNGEVLPETVTGVWNNYRDKEVNDELLLSYGYGDGGGGPTRTMLEMRRRLEHMPGLPRVTTGRADEFFSQLEQKVRETDRYVHKWDGELYLELHRGTYTSQAYNKKMNRRMENLLRNAEIVSAFASSMTGYDAYPRDLLNESWKIVLRNQFHDILPGSSIAEVYEDCRVEYAEAERLAARSFEMGMQRIAGMISKEGEAGWVVMNTLPWRRTDLVEIPWTEQLKGKVWTDASGQPQQIQRITGPQGDRLLIRVDIPGMGYKTIFARDHHAAGAKELRPASRSQITVSGRGAETPFYSLEWNASGQLTRLYDKRTNREVLASGQSGNRFEVHEDKPLSNDAWDIDIYYRDKMRHITDLKSIEIMEEGPLRTAIRFIWHYGHSVLTQQLILYPDDPRIEFQTHVDWRERQQLLKVAFPLEVRATEATHEIQFGSVKRPTHWNTSWDFARFETCAQRWVDLSERGLGASLLNDCKYGHDVRDNVLRLTLIKSAINPDPAADLGEHAFTYALLPHEGDWFTAEIPAHAHRLNIPLEAVELSGTDHSYAAGILPADFSFFECLADHVMVDTIKAAEDSDDWIIRCYEYGGKRGEVSFSTHYRIESVEEVNLMERAEHAVFHTEIGFTAPFKPFEIKTFRIKQARSQS